MDLALLVEGGTLWQERFEKALQRSNLAQSAYKRDKTGVTRTLIQNRLLMPLYVDFNQTFGQRWLGLFQLLNVTQPHQTIMIVRNQFFPPMNDVSLPKRWYLLPAKRWDSEKGNDNLSVKESLEAKLHGFTLEQVRGIDDVPVGMDFAGVGANTHYKVTNPYNWLRGRKMLSSQSPTVRYEPSGKNATIRLQFGREDLSQALDVGIRIVAENVPSLSGEQEPHKLTITNVPVYYVEMGVNEITKRRGYGIFTSDDCMRNAFADDKFSRKVKSQFGREERTGSENEFDHHSVFVLDAAAVLVSQQYPMLAIDNPIPKVPNGVEELVELTFRRIRVIGPGVTDEGIMLWQSKALMQVYTMMGIAYLNSKQLQEQRQMRIPGKRAVA